ncbi:MAG: tetratricopeptide repeat protein [Pyrinomonadaceae bacterium]|nr:tetratricopeptide repeat protein [Pyrinomonadaceae bacterium]
MNPSYSQAHHWFGLLLISLARPMDAADQLETAARLDPDSLIVKTELAMAFFHSKHYDEAKKICENVLSENEEFVPALKVLRWTYLMKKDYRSARSVFQKELSYSGGDPGDPDWNMISAQVESLEGNKRRIGEKLDRSLKHSSAGKANSAFSYENALAYNLLGNREKALKWLEKAEIARDTDFIMLEIDPRFENLRTEPRFQKLLRKLKKRS